MTAKSRITTALATVAVALAVSPLVVGASSASPSAPEKTVVPTTAVGGTPTVPPPTVAPTGAPTAPTTVAPSVPGSTVPGVPTAPPGTGSTVTPPTGAAPLGTVLTDNTGRITVTVPSTWTDTDTRSSVRDDGGRRPTITASPDLSQWTEGWAVPGMYLAALPPTVDPAALVSAYTWQNACTEGPVTPYNDGRYVGHMQTWSNCGGGATSLTAMAGRSIDNTYTVYAQIQVTAPNDPALQTILASIGAVPGANPGEVSPPATPPATLGPVPATLLQGTVAPGSTTVTDDTGRISLAVPATWTDVDPSSRANDDFSDRPHLVAAPVIDDYFSDWAAPGLELWAFPYRADPYTLLVNRGWAGDCDDSGVQSLDIRGFTGLMQTWSNCGDTTTRIISFAVSPADQSATLYFEVQLPTADDSSLTTALASFALNPA